MKRDTQSRGDDVDCWQGWILDRVGGLVVSDRRYVDVASEMVFSFFLKKVHYFNSILISTSKGSYVIENSCIIIFRERMLLSFEQVIWKRGNIGSSARGYLNNDDFEGVFFNSSSCLHYCCNSCSNFGN
ncbi:hypothetical protein Y032_0086g1983 [Ancylostoma ceylanicum]|uniref:Uncharacterized protein n=1 Tax=Ancylostoma ceylanicum TaxID=53326 RepID=A0A016TQN7_9BILA|nr:hypothetical protein Y032_0086g1983 [Ancylostoma ceylanicum]